MYGKRVIVFLCFFFFSFHFIFLNRAFSVDLSCVLARSVPSVFFEVSRELDIPVAWLVVIAYKESRLNPYAVNVNGKSYYFKNLMDAFLFLYGELYKEFSGRAKISYDIGLMQINRFWVERYNLSLFNLFHPAYNLRVGAMILRYCLQKYGRQNVFACYHQGRPGQEGKRYQREIVKLLRQLR